MKFHIKKLSLLTVLPAVLLAGVVHAQTAAPRLAAPLVIPATPAQQQASANAEPARKVQLQLPMQAAPAPAAQPVVVATPASSVPVQPAAAMETRVETPRTHDDFAEIMMQTGPQPKVVAAKEKPKVDIPGPGGTRAAAERAEMIARMRIVVEQIAAEYGNPTFAQVFTNDAVQAQVLRKRVQMLHRMEAIKAEITALQKQKEDVTAELDASRQDLVALQQQAEALTNRLQKARFALGMASN